LLGWIQNLALGGSQTATPACIVWANVSQTAKTWDDTTNTAVNYSDSTKTAVTYTDQVGCSNTP